MGFRTGSYATIWGVESKGNYSVVEMSTSKKNKATNEYETDFSSKFVRFIGTANTKIAGSTKGTKIKIGDCEVTNSYDKEKKISYTNFLVFSFDAADGGTTKKTNLPATGSDGFMNIPDGIEEDLPFN